SDLGHTQSLRTGDLECATLMTALGEERECDLRDIFDIDWRKPHVIEWLPQDALASDACRFTEIELHELGGTQMRPREAGLLQVPLDLLMHSREGKLIRVEADAGFFAGELHHMSYARRLAGIDEPTLCRGHLRVRARYHQGSIDTLKRAIQRFGARHIAFADLNKS